MATIITETVKPSGGDYTLLSLAVAAVPASLVATDEQWNIEVSTFSGGLADSVSMPTITSDATRYLEIRAAAGDEYLPHLDTGIFLTASVAFAGVFVNGGTHFCRLKNIGFKNTRTAASGRGVDWFADDGLTEGLYSTTLSTSGAILYFMNNAVNHTIRECISYLGTTGFDFGNNDPRTADKLTSIDASAVGIDTGTADTTITNSFSFGSTDPWLGTFNASSSNNASDGTDAPGGSSLQNRTSADFANFAGNDFRTASGSALATAGTVDFIGYALEVASGNTLTADSGTYTYTGTNAELIRAKILQADPGSYTYTGTNVNLLTGFRLVADSGAYVYTGTDATLIFTPVGASVLAADSGTYTYTGTDSNLKVNRVIIGQTGTYAYAGTDATLTFTPAFAEVLVAESGGYTYAGTEVQIILPGQIWTDKASAVTNWTNQPQTITIWTDK